MYSVEHEPDRPRVETPVRHNKSQREMSLREQCQNLERVANNGLTNSEVLEAATGDLRFEVLSFREEYTSAVQTTWTLLSAFVAFLILAGLALVQVAVSRSHSDNVLFKVKRCLAHSLLVGRVAQLSFHV